MTLDELRAGLDEAPLGRELYDCVADLYPLCRSLAGDGLRETLRRLQRRVPLTLHEVPLTYGECYLPSDLIEAYDREPSALSVAAAAPARG